MPRTTRRSGCSPTIRPGARSSAPTSGEGSRSTTCAGTSCNTFGVASSTTSIYARGSRWADDGSRWSPPATAAATQSPSTASTSARGGSPRSAPSRQASTCTACACTAAHARGTSTSSSTASAAAGPSSSTASGARPSRGSASVRSFDVGSEADGCVADDVFGRSLHRRGETRDLAIRRRADCRGGALARRLDRTRRPPACRRRGSRARRRAQRIGFLIASSQGDDTFVAYRREGDNAYVGSFRIGAHAHRRCRAKRRDRRHLDPAGSPVPARRLRRA